MKTLTALALCIAISAGFATAAFAHGWHGRGGHGGPHSGWNMQASGYGGPQYHYRGGGPCWGGWNADRDYGRQYERGPGQERDMRQGPDRDYAPREQQQGRGMPR